MTQRVAEAGLDLSELVGVCLTHHHSDHVSDLANLAIARWANGATTPLSVTAPDGPSAEFASSCMSSFHDQAFYSQAPPEAGSRPLIEVRAFEPSAEPGEIGQLGSFEVSAVLVDHHPIEAAVGYRVTNGATSIVVSGDTAACAGIETIANGADLLIHEALLEVAVRPQLLEWNASAGSVGALAHRARVRHLVLTHLIPAPANEHDEAEFVDEARQGGFTGPITMAQDLLELNVG